MTSVELGTVNSTNSGTIESGGYVPSASGGRSRTTLPFGMVKLVWPACSNWPFMYRRKPCNLSTVGKAAIVVSGLGVGAETGLGVTAGAVVALG